jgi:hypothetical protein
MFGSIIICWAMVLFSGHQNNGVLERALTYSLVFILTALQCPDSIKSVIIDFCERCYRWWTVPGRSRALQDLGINNIGGGKKTRRKRRKRKKKTKRRRRKKRGGGKRVKIKAIDGMNIEVEYKMDDGTKRIYKGEIVDHDNTYVKVNWHEALEGEENPSWIIWDPTYYTKDTIVAADALLELRNSPP